MRSQIPLYIPQEELPEEKPEEIEVIRVMNLDISQDDSKTFIIASW